MPGSLCPYRHQLCADIGQCTITPDQVQAWWEEAKAKYPQTVDRHGKPIKPLAVEAARYAFVQARPEVCRQARPFMTATPAQSPRML